MKIKLINHLLSCAIISIGMTTTFTASADSLAKEDKHLATTSYKQIMKQADADYTSAQAKCEALKGNEKDICQKDAKATFESIKADAQADRDSNKAYAEADSKKREAAYEAAKEQCKLLKGTAEDACIKQAKATYWQ